MIRCPNCRRPVDQGDQICSFCNEPLRDRQNSQEADHSRSSLQSQGEQEIRQSGGQNVPNEPTPQAERNSGRAEGNSVQRTRQSVSNPPKNIQEAHTEQQRQSRDSPSGNRSQTIQKIKQKISGQGGLFQSSSENHFVSSFLPGATAGAGAFLIGFLITYLIKANEAQEALSGSLLGSEPETYQGVGWVFFVMHNVSISTSASGPGGSFSQSVGPGELNDTYLFIVPIILLALAGYLIAKRMEATTLVSGLKWGATTVIGYIVLVTVFVFIVTFETSTSTFRGEASVSLGPDLAPAIVIAGLIYPIILGGIGGIICGISNNDTHRQRY